MSRNGWIALLLVVLVAWGLGNSRLGASSAVATLGQQVPVSGVRFADAYAVALPLVVSGHGPVAAPTATPTATPAPSATSTSTSTLVPSATPTVSRTPTATPRWP